MNKIVHYLGLDVHKESIAVSIAPQNSTEVRRYGIIGGTLDAVDKLIQRLSRPDVELRFVYEAGPCGFVLCRHLRSKGIRCDVETPFCSGLMRWRRAARFRRTLDVVKS